MDEAASGDGKAEEKPLSKALRNKIMLKMVFLNPVLWVIALANFCMNVIRGTILDWGGAFLVQDKGFDISLAGTVVGSCELVGVILSLVLSAFFIYGPQALYGTCASMQCTKHAAGTGNGVIGILGYLSTFVSGIWFGHIAGGALGWDRVYILTIAFGILGSLIIAPLWKVPADGYEKVNKVIAEHPSR